MGIKTPADFEDSTGTITRLSGEIDFHGTGTVGQVLTVDTGGKTASFKTASGGGGVQATYSGNPVTIGNGAQAELTFDTLDSGTELLDRSTPAEPKLLAAGTYTLCAQASAPALTAGGTAILSAYDGVTPMPSPTAKPQFGWSAVLTFVGTAGQSISVLGDNEDGVAARAFTLTGTRLVKIA